MKIYYLRTSVLQEKDTEKLLRYADEKRKERYCKNKDIPRLAAGALLNLALEEYNVDYLKEEKILYGNGKEGFKDLDLKYNISHSDTVCVCAVCDDEVGIDCEDVLKKDNCLKIAKRFFTAKEYEKVLLSADHRDEFTKMWTVKESYIKYTSKGFEIPLNSFECLSITDTVIINDATVKTYKISDTYVSVCAKTEKFPDNLTDMTQFFL